MAAVDSPGPGPDHTSAVAHGDVADGERHDQPHQTASDVAAELELTTPAEAWGPTRGAFGQRAGRPATAPSAADLGASPASQAWERPRLDDDDIEALLESQAPLEVVSETLQPDPDQGLDGIETALRRLSDEMQATQAQSEAGRAVTNLSQRPPPTWGQASADALVQLGVDIARLVEVVDCGFDRIEAMSAKQTVELRSEVAELFEALTDRIASVEQRSVPAATDADAELSVGPADASSEAQDHPEPGPALAERFGETAADVGDAPGWQAHLAPGADVAGAPLTDAYDPDVDLFEAPADSHRAPFPAADAAHAAWLAPEIGKAPQADRVGGLANLDPPPPPWDERDIGPALRPAGDGPAPQTSSTDLIAWPGAPEASRPEEDASGGPAAASGASADDLAVESAGRKGSLFGLRRVRLGGGLLRKSA